MNKGQLIDAIAAESGLSKEKSRKALNALIKIGGENLGKGERIIVNKYGSLSTKMRSARKGTNPNTGEPIIINSKKVIFFRANCPPPR